MILTFCTFHSHEILFIFTDACRNMTRNNGLQSIHSPNFILTMNRLYTILLMAGFLLAPFMAVSAPKGKSISGKILVTGTKEPVPGAAVNITDTGLWTVSDADGTWSFDNVQPGDITLTASCLGFVENSICIRLENEDIHDVVIHLSEQSLALDEVVVTAQREKDGMSTNFSFGTNALSHLQMSNVTDIGALLPGGKTIDPDLTVNSTISLRNAGSAAGNAAFGTALEVDGVRLSNNGSFGELAGSGTRSISVENIESVEVITGVPSAEYGDLNSGMVRINTKKGKTPLNVTFSVNPKTYQVSASKGIAVSPNGGVLNLSAEWTRAVSKLSSPYTSYTRRGMSLSYSNTFAKVLRFEAGVTGNIGGMDSKDDPDANTGAYEKVRDNVLRANTSLTWLVNRPWITNLRLDASVNFNDNLSHTHDFFSSASNMPAVHAEEEGYFLADRLPLSYFADKMVDSKQLDYAASLKYEWFRRWGKVNNNLKAGIQWKATGNVGEGEYYLDPALAENGYRPWPYRNYPYMHNLAAYIEDNIAIPLWTTTLNISAGVRMENVFVKGSQYDRLHSLSPRLNAKWALNDWLTVRGGWGISEKLPSFYVLYPRPEYRDILTFGLSHGNETSYVYYTKPYSLMYNENLKWQRSSNAEIGIETAFHGFSLSLTGFLNKTIGPYKYSNTYSPMSYNILEQPDGFEMADNPEIKVDSQTGMVSVLAKDGTWQQMNVKVTDQTFFESQYADNGADVTRAGVEMIADFPEISAIGTKFRFDASCAYSKYIDNTLAYYYNEGLSHTSISDRSYQYVGIYANGGNMNSTANGKITHSLDANLTAITHIPQARIIITCRLEMSLLQRFRNISEYEGHELAYNIEEGTTTATGGSIYDGASYTAVRPVAYMDLDGNIHPFTDEEASKSEFSHMILRSGNAYTFVQDGYGPYFSANLSVTKEIGDHVSISFFANNFTNSRMAVRSLATGVTTILTPSFFYGLTCRLKF